MTAVPILKNREGIFVKGGTLHEISHIYHVTNIKKGEKKKYEKLVMTVADDQYYDGPLVYLPCLFFTTTLYRDKNKGVISLPTISNYPRYSRAGEEYYRVCVPVEKFSKFEFLYLCKGERRENTSEKEVPQETTSAKEEDLQSTQVRLVLCRDDKLEKYKERFERLEMENNQYLVRRKERWFSNVYPSSKMFVNFVILEELELDDTCLWDLVTRSNSGPGGGTDPKNTIVSTKDRFKICETLWSKNREIEKLKRELRQLKNATAVASTSSLPQKPLF